MLSRTTAQPSAIRSKLARDDGGIKWQDLLSHFRNVQSKHEKLRRGEAAMSILAPSGSTGTSMGSPPTSNIGNSPTPNASGSSAVRPQIRRKVTDGLGSSRTVTSGAVNALSPLNPKARTTPASALAGTPRPMSPSGGKPPQRKPMGVNGGKK